MLRQTNFQVSQVVFVHIGQQRNLPAQISSHQTEDKYSVTLIDGRSFDDIPTKKIYRFNELTSNNQIRRLKISHDDCNKQRKIKDIRAANERYYQWLQSRKRLIERQSFTDDKGLEKQDKQEQKPSSQQSQSHNTYYSSEQQSDDSVYRSQKHQSDLFLMCRNLRPLRQRLVEQGTNVITGNLCKTLDKITASLNNFMSEQRLTDGDTWFLFGLFANNIVTIENMWKSGSFEKVIKFATEYERKGGVADYSLPYQVMTIWLYQVCSEFQDRMWEYQMDAAEAVKMLNEVKKYETRGSESQQQ